MENIEMMALKIMDAREKRVEKQVKLSELFSLPLVSFSMNIPGPRKDSELFRRAFDSGVEVISESLEKCIENKDIEYLDTGSEMIISVNMDAVALKKKMLDIESKHPLGRFFDIDVLDENLKGISRSDVGIGRRTCFVCNKEATVCRREGNHTLDALISFIENSILDYFGEKE